MYNKGCAKRSSLHRLRNWAYAVCLCLATLLLAGCAMMSRPAATPVPVIAEEMQGEVQATPAPEIINPLKAFLNAFYEAYVPCGASLNALMKEDTTAVDEALTAARHIQRLRQIFDAQAGLLQNPYDPSTWDGILFGNVEGTGSVTRTIDGCTFSCTLADEQSAEGTSTISGSLKGNVLFGEWIKPDGSTYSSSIVKTETGYCAYVNWAGESAMIFMEDGALSYGENVEPTATASSLQHSDAWVNWHLQQGALFEHAAAATSSSLQEATE